MIMVVVFLFLFSALYESATVLKQARTKVKVIHFAIMLASFSVLTLYSLNVDIPSPSDAIIDILEAIFKLSG
ncbi:MAG: hypothetical protein ACOX8S_06765 [Christensenellales bacterium]|jgi:hypothetical protein